MTGLLQLTDDTNPLLTPKSELTPKSDKYR